MSIYLCIYLSIISLYQEMDTAEDELKRTRVLYQKKMMEFQVLGLDPFKLF